MRPNLAPPPHFSSGGDVQRASACVGFALEDRGYHIARRVVSRASIARIQAELEPDFVETPFCTGDFYGERTKRFGGLLVRSPEMTRLVLHPLVQALAERVLGPWCDTVQLNLTQAIEISSGALAQLPHRDQDMWRGETGRIEYLLNVIWPLTPFKASNGATLIWPESHGSASAHIPDTEPVTAECEPGDAILFLGSTLHGAGAHVGGAPRRAIVVSYCLGWLKPYENQWLVYPPDVARRFAPELAALVGYRQHRPNLGNYEGQCPSVLLRDDRARRLGAIDALRPDQELALAAHVNRSRQLQGRAPAPHQPLR